MAYCAGLADAASLKALLHEFAHVELRHFFALTSIISDMGWDATTEPVELKLLKDELEILILLLAVEETLVHYYENMMAPSDRPLRKRLKAMLEEEQEHRNQMQVLLREAKSALRSTANES